MGLIETMVEEIFQKQFRYSNGRHSIQSPLSPPQRMQWIGSKHCAILFHELHDRFGDDYFLADYMCGKLYGHMFCPAVGQFTSVQKFIIPLEGTIVKRFGWGDIKVLITDYKKGEYWFEFRDSPIAREICKLFGKQKTPVDSMIAGLSAGSLEHILNQKLAAIETTCLAQGDKACTLVVSDPKNIRKNVLKKLKGNTAKIAAKILDLEDKHDFLKEAEQLAKNQDKKALQAEAKFLKT